MALAEKFNLTLVCYEGGQTLATENDNPGFGANLTDLTIWANGHPRKYLVHAFQVFVLLRTSVHYFMNTSHTSV